MVLGVLIGAPNWALLARLLGVKVSVFRWVLGGLVLAGRPASTRPNGRSIFPLGGYVKMLDEWGKVAPGELH